MVVFLEGTPISVKNFCSSLGVAFGLVVSKDLLAWLLSFAR